MALKYPYFAAAIALCCASPGWAQDAARSAIIQQLISRGAQLRDIPSGTIITPASSLLRAEDLGVRAHTNFKIFIPATLPSGPAVPAGNNAPPFSGYYFETPSSLACGYNLVTPANGCNPNTFHTNASGGSRAIAIVDAYNNPTVRSDLAAYSAQFGLPAVTSSNFVIWYCVNTEASCNQTTPPANNSDWATEITLDVQMAHALAPSATIYLVEAKSSSNRDLYAAVDKASALVAAAGGGEVSMSWGGAETSNETSSDYHFRRHSVVFFAAAGDLPGTSYPAISSYVTCVGGTSFARNAAGSLIGQAAWSNTGGGPSLYISRPSYQPASIGSERACPDVSANAGNETSVWIYCTASTCGPGVAIGNWYLSSGTSEAAPSMAAIVNNAGSFKANTGNELSLIYRDLANPGAYARAWYDVTQGTCGPGVGLDSAASVYLSLWTGTGYDFCSGVGAPNTTAGK